jgi:hypothetical protein
MRHSENAGQIPVLRRASARPLRNLFQWSVSTFRKTQAGRYIFRLKHWELPEDCPCRQHSAALGKISYQLGKRGLSA